FAIAAAFGFASIMSTILLGDESGYEIGDVQKTKLAVMEAEWHTEEAPAAFTLFGLPNEETQTTDYAVKIPYVLGLIATRSLDKKVTGIAEIKEQHEKRIRNGMNAYALLQKLKNGEDTPENRQQFMEKKKDLGYGLLLKKYTNKVVDANEEQIQKAVDDSVPHVPSMFWSFRLMVGLGFWMLLLFAFTFYESIRQRIGEKRWLLKLALISLPFPWIAAELGWVVAEVGRQPWTIAEVLPTHLSVSSLTTSDLMGSLAGFVIFYTILLIAEVYLMVKFIRQGPGVLGTGRYHNDTHSIAKTTEI
ncbi:MAG: cytochrome d terminal oxidase subunit 1, partial [Gammaproteobacteria bacterium]